MSTSTDSEEMLQAIPSGRSFIAFCYEIFLGRDLDSADVAEERGAWSIPEMLHSILTCDEHIESVTIPLRWGLPFSTNLFEDRLTMACRMWIVDHLPIAAGSAEAVMVARSWRDLLTTLLSDERMMKVAGADPLASVRGMSGGDEVQAGEAVAFGDGEVLILGRRHRKA